MSTVTQRLTAEELWNLPDHGGRCELVRGELREMSPAGFDHGSVTIRLTAPLAVYVLQHQLGEVAAAETGFIISRDPDTVRAPDFAFVAQARVPKAGRPRNFWVGSPDLAIETVSPFDTVVDVDEKVQDWLAGGTSLVWVLNPRQKTVTAYRPGGTARILKVDETLDGEGVVPGFRIAVSEIFA